MWHVYWFVNILIRKRLIFVPIQIGVWYILAKKYCILIGRFDATLFQSLTRLYCIPALISEATILLNWLETVLAKKYTPCQGVVWSQYRLSGTFYVPFIFGVVLFAKVCFFLPMQFYNAMHMYHSQNSSFITLLRFEESSISEVLVCNCQCNIKTMQNPTNIVDLCPSGQAVYFSHERWQVQSL